MSLSEPDSAPHAGDGRPARPSAEELRRRRRPGDGWIETPQGRFWGRFGAAGLLLHDPQRGVLLQHRVEWSAHGGTWGIPGGAIDPDETPVQGALRESREEAGVPGSEADIDILGTHVVDKDGWAYTTVIARTRGRLEESISDAESLELAWVPLDRVEDYELHPGFGAAWPALRAVLERG